MTDDLEPFSRQKFGGFDRIKSELINQLQIKSNESTCSDLTNRTSRLYAYRARV